MVLITLWALVLLYMVDSYPAGEQKKITQTGHALFDPTMTESSVLPLKLDKDTFLAAYKSETGTTKWWLQILRNPSCIDWTSSSPSSERVLGLDDVVNGLLRPMESWKNPV